MYNQIADNFLVTPKCNEIHFFRVMHPVKMACGFLATSVMFMIFIYITNEKETAAQFKRSHPIVSIVIIFSAVYLLAYMLQSLLVFFLGILMPFTCKSNNKY